MTIPKARDTQRPPLTGAPGQRLAVGSPRHGQPHPQHTTGGTMTYRLHSTRTRAALDEAREVLHRIGVRIIADALDGTLPDEQTKKAWRAAEQSVVYATAVHEQTRAREDVEVGARAVETGAPR